MLRTLFASLALLAASSQAAPMLSQIEGPGVDALKAKYEPKPEAPVVLDGGRGGGVSARVAAAKAKLEAAPAEAPALDGAADHEGVSPGIQARIDAMKAA